MSIVETVETVETVENAMLSTAMRAALVAAPKKHPKSILTAVRIHAGPHGIEITGNNLECAFQAGLPTNETGAVVDIAVPRTAAETWIKAGVERIDVESCAAAAAGIRAPVEDGREHPSIDLPSTAAAEMSLPFPILADVEKHIGAAADEESSRYALGGVYVESGAGCVRFVGTDGRRLHVFRFSRPSEGAFHHVIPLYALTAAAKCIGLTIDGRGAAKKKAAAAMLVRLTIDEKGRGAFRWNVGNCSFRFTFRCIEGRFPRYRDVFPAWVESGNLASGWIDADDVSYHAETCRKNVCTENSKGVDIVGPGAGHNCAMRARAADRGEYDRPIVGSLPIGFSRKLDPRFLVDAIRAAVQFSGGSNHVEVFATMDKGDAVYLGKPGDVFREGAGDCFAAVIMPLAAD